MRGFIVRKLWWMTSGTFSKSGNLFFRSRAICGHGPPLHSAEVTYKRILFEQKKISRPSKKPECHSFDTTELLIQVWLSLENDVAIFIFTMCIWMRSVRITLYRNSFAIGDPAPWLTISSYSIFFINIVSSVPKHTLQCFPSISQNTEKRLRTESARFGVRKRHECKVFQVEWRAWDMALNLCVWTRSSSSSRHLISFSCWSLTALS